MANFRITSTDDNSRFIASSHFALNFVADWDRIGSQPWQRFDELIQILSIRDLRYPGGITSEVGFNIRTPNATTISVGGASTREIMGAFDFAQFCRSNGITASYIIPTEQVLLDTRDSSGLRRADPAMLGYVRDFVLGVLRASGGNVSTFEIGNEYESYMSAREYGALVNVLAPIVSDAIDQFQRENQAETNRPTITMQIWSWLANDASTLNSNDLEGRAGSAISQLSTRSRELIDAVATHWYARDRGRDLQDAYHDLESDIQQSMAVVEHGLSLLSEGTELFVSEWNANHNAVPFFGLAQIPIAVRLFSELVQAGANSLAFWSGMYHPTSLALPNGELTPIGVVFNYLRISTLGLSPRDLVFEQRSLGGVGFVGQEKAVVFSSNLTTEIRTLDFSSEELIAGFFPSRIGFVGADIRDADGVYRSFRGLASFNEPDLRGTITWSQDRVATSSPANLNPYQTVIIEFDRRFVVQGTNSDDYFRASSRPEYFSGGAGQDTVDYSNSQGGISVVLGDSEATGGHADWDRFASIENVVGSEHDDTILGSNADNSLWGGIGNDYIHGYGGNDIIFTGGGADTVLGGSGNDVIYLQGGSTEARGGEGNDTFVVSLGNHDIFGQAGVDTLDLRQLAAGVTIWFDAGSVDFSDSGFSVRFAGVEVINSTNYDDRITVYSRAATLLLNDGDDYAAFFEDSRGIVHGGNGNDYFFSKSKDLEIFGDRGNDVIFTDFGSVNYLSPGVGNDTVFSHGDDTFVFELGDGRDVWHAFDPTSDSLLLGSRASAELRSGLAVFSENANGTLLQFSGADSILFAELDLDLVRGFADNWFT